MLCDCPVPALAFIPWFQVPTYEVPIPGLDTGLPLPPFGILVAIGVMAGSELAQWYGKRIGIERYVVADLVFHVIVTAFICAYFGNALLYEPEVFWDVVTNPSQLLEMYLGLSSYGGFFGAVLGLLIWKYRTKHSALWVGGAVSFGFPLGWLFGRTGCFLVHDHPGKETDFFLAVDNYRFGYPPFVPRHDLGLYEVFWSAATAGLFFYLARKPRKPGFFLALLPVLYAPVRFGLDFLRADPLEGGDARYAGLTPAQYGSIAAFAAGCALLYWIEKNPPVVLPPNEESTADETDEADEADEDETGGDKPETNQD